jgi:phage shock protein C
MLAGIGGVIIYIIAAVIIPDSTQEFSDSDGERNNHGYTEDNTGNNEWNNTTHYDNGKGKLIIGAGLVLVGLFAMFKQFFPRMDLDFLWPVILIGIGIFIIFRGRWSKYE